MWCVIPASSAAAGLWGVDQMMGADRSLVTVGRSLTVANGFPPLRTQHTVTPAAYT